MGYFVRRRKTGWILQKTYYENGKCHAPTIPASQHFEHLFNSTMTIEEAREQAKRLNRELHTSQWMIKKEAILKRIHKEARDQIHFLPDALCAGFELELLSLPDPKRIQTTWRAARKLIKAVRIPPEDWRRRSQAIYNYFEEHRLSPAYAKKIIRIMNLWGEFYASKTKAPYSRLMPPTGFAAGRILRTYRAHLKRDKASDGLTPELLFKIRSSLSPHQFNWLHASLWFGLRPQEVRNLNRGQNYTFFDTDKPSGVELLNILQTKLINLAEDDQWKCIPILYPEQQLAAHNIRAGTLEEPLPKTIKRYTMGNHHLYAGRKGFGPLMWELGNDVVEVSSWLGHKSIDRTYRDYMKWKRLKLRTRPADIINLASTAKLHS